MAMQEVVKVVVSFTPASSEVSLAARGLLQRLHTYKMGTNPRLDLQAHALKGIKSSDNQIEVVYTNKETDKFKAGSKSADQLWKFIENKAERVQNEKLLKAAGFDRAPVHRTKEEVTKVRERIWPG